MLVTADGSETGVGALDALGRESLALYPEFVASVERISQVSVGYRVEESLWIATHQDDLDEMDRVERTLQAKAAEVERLTAEQLLALEPSLSGRLSGGLRLRRDPQVDPWRLDLGLRKAIEAMGGRVFEGMAVERVEERGGDLLAVGGTRADGAPFTWTGSEVVLAVDTSTLGPIEVSLARPDLYPVKGHLLRLRGRKLLDRLVRTPEVHLVPRADGELLIGTTLEECDRFGSPTAGAVMDALRHAWEILPEVYDLELGEVSAGLSCASADQHPVIGATSVEGVFLALGHARDLALLVPATAHHLTRWIVDGKTPVELEPFAPSRMTPDAVS
jgi:glycine oxidase